jgi:hypothetical protein
MFSTKAVVRSFCGLAMLASFLLAPANAAEIERRVTAKGAVSISIAGEIVEGDGQAVRLEIVRAEAEGYAISEIQLNSVGGRLFEGGDIARTIRAASLKTVVASGATCASACFLAFAAGLTRSVHSGARVGVHAACNESGDENHASSAATAAMARIAKILGVPSAIIEGMITTPSSEMFWLSKSNFVSMGAVVDGGR